MAKKNGFGKFLMFCTVVGAACAGAYLYMNKQDNELADDFDDDFDDFDDFSDDDEDKESRKYVNLTREDETSTDIKPEENQQTASDASVAKEASASTAEKVSLENAPVQEQLEPAPATPSENASVQEQLEPAPAAPAEEPPAPKTTTEEFFDDTK